jgi:hypothetical protein
MAGTSLEFWQCPEALARSGSHLVQRQAWHQLGSAERVLSACRRAAEAAEAADLINAWESLQAPEVEAFVADITLGSGTRGQSPVDAGRLVRGLRGLFAAALAARAALWCDPAALLGWVHAAARLWGGTSPAEGLAAPLPGPYTSAGFEAARPGGRAGALEPARVLDDHFRALARLPGGWRVGAARDCAAVLLGGGRAVARRLTMPVLGFEAAGRVLRLGVELLRDGTGECYPDPQRLGLLPMTGTFLNAAETAWAEARREAEAGRAVGYDARWWVVAPDAGPAPQVLDGASMGAALAVLLVLLLRGHPIDPAVALTAELLPGGWLKKVDAVGAKSRAFFALSPPLKYVVVHPGNQHEVQTAAADAERDPAASVRTAANLTQTVRHVSGLPTDLLRYYEALIAAPEGDKGDPAPAYGGRALAKLFVPPDFIRLDPERTRQPPPRGEGARGSTGAATFAGPEVRDLGEDALFGEAGASERLSWDEARDQWGGEGARVVVLGAPGQGKSVLTRMLAREIAREGRKHLTGGEPPRPEDLLLPVVLPLNLLLAPGLPEGLDPDAPLRAVVADLLAGTTGCSPDAARYLAEHAHEARTWLILDALDELGADPVSAAARDRLFELLRRPGWLCRVLITTRPYGYDPAGVRLGETLFRLAPLSDGQQRDLSDNWFHDAPNEVIGGRGRVDSLRRQPAVRGMAQNAFLLSLLCGVAEEGEVPGNVRRTQLYDRALRRVLGGERRAAQWLACLRELAFRIFRNDENNLLTLEEDLIDFVRESRFAPPLERDAAKPGDGGRGRTDQEVAIGLIEELLRKRLLVRVRGRGAMMMAHRSFAEFLAARYLEWRVKDQGWEHAQVTWIEGGGAPGRRPGGPQGVAAGVAGGARLPGRAAGAAAAADRVVGQHSKGRRLPASPTAGIAGPGGAPRDGPSGRCRSR